MKWYEWADINAGTLFVVIADGLEAARKLVLEEIASTAELKQKDVELLRSIIDTDPMVFELPNVKFFGENW